MHVLLVYAHQDDRSFNGTLKDIAVKTLTRAGHSVTISDLYTMNFKATATSDDIKDYNETESFSYGSAMAKAWKSGDLSDDIVAEQKKISEADLIIFQFPMYWKSLPAILKGWMDRVLIFGFAFDLSPPLSPDTWKWYDQGLFNEKKAMLSFTTGGPQSNFSPRGIQGDIDIMLWPIQSGILHFCGFKVLRPQITYALDIEPRHNAEKSFREWEERLKHITEEEPLQFIPSREFKSDNGYGLMTEQYIESLEGDRRAPTVGQHLGKPLL